MTTSDFISALRADISGELEERLMAKLEPMIEQKLFNNVFSVERAAKYLSLSAGTIYRMVNENEIPSFRMRGQIFLRQTSIDEWIKEQEKQSYKVAQ